MPKRIVFCADGTWDSPTVACPTNVYTLYKALTTGPDQYPLYDDGVGANGTPIDRLAGGAFGAGLFQKIKDGYTKIAHLYETDDQIFIFGFSRGAYTARSLAGMIAICGLPTNPLDPATNSLVDEAFQAYRSRDPRQRAALLDGLKQYNLYDARIAMVGVWDTVGSLGVPSVVGGVDPILCGFLDTSLHPDVMNAYQALAIDERRVEFPPTLWAGQPTPNQTVEQVWFVGVHSDVGGGYARPGLSDITLSWIASKAANLGVTFAAGALAQIAPQYALDPGHESWNVGWGFPKRRTIAGDASVASTAQLRCQNDASYRPGNLQISTEGDLLPPYSIVAV